MSVKQGVYFHTLVEVAAKVKIRYLLDK